MLTASQSFRAGFLLRCAEEGLSQSQTDDRLSAVSDFVKRAEGVIGDLTGAAMKIPLSAIGTGILAGGTAGVALGMATPDDMTKSPRPAYLDDVQRAELISTYRQQAAQLRRQIEVGRRRAARMATVGRSPYGI